MSLDNKIKYDIYNFLDEHLVEKGKKYTHTSMGKPTGSFFIKEEELDTFYNLYQEAIFNGKKLHITEKHEDIGPIVIDLDFKYEHEIFERKHNKDTIKKIVGIYNEIILDILDIDEDDTRLNAFVFERESVYRVKAITKDGIHILYPNIITPPEVQYYIRECVLKKIVPILEDLPLNNKPYDVVDRSVIRDTNWLLYGGSKPNIEPYQLTGIYNGKLEELNVTEYNFDKNIAHYFSIRNKKESEVVHIKEDKQNLLENINLKKKNIRIKRKNIVVDDYEEIKQLVNILNDERAESYSEWISLGWLLHNIDSNSQELLDLWIDFSKRSSKFKEGTCEKEWNRSRNEGLGLPTLHYWAKIDNFEKYRDIQESSLNKLVEKSIKTPTHCDIANVLYKKYEHDFKYSSEEWYKFESPVWVKEKDGISLRAKISNELVEIYSKIISNFNKIITSHDPEVTEEDKEECKNKNKEVLEIIKKLKTTGFKDNILKECREKFYDKNFVNKLDTNNYLIGFKNGIYDLQSGELRDGRPDDYLEMTTEIDKIDFEESNENYEDMQHFIDTIFVDKEVRDYFMLYLASCLQGHNAEEKFRIWTGSGCHAYNTKIMMYDGNLKNVQDIKVGDKLMGDDSKERNVLELKRGYDKMYEFETIRNDKFIVNGEHILSLMATQIGSFINSVKESRFKLTWQERNENGIPVTKCKNFPYKSNKREIYKKSVVYYENSDEAYKEGLKFRQKLYENNENIIKKGDIIDISVNKYLEIKNKIGERNYYLFKTGIEFEEKELILEPYVLGYWLGDGTSKTSSITTMDTEIIKYFQEYAKENDLKVSEYKNENNKASTYLFTREKDIGDRYANKFLKKLKELNLIDNKHIPEIYKKNSRKNQLELLAGLIDSDGHYQKKSKQYEITLKSKDIIEDLSYISRSLGFSTTIREVNKNIKKDNKIVFEGVYYNLIIYGNNLDEIPVKISRKKAEKRLKNKNPNVYSFKIKELEKDNYYGFELDGNHRYLMDNFIVTHNSNGKSKMIELFVSCMGGYSIKFPITLLTGKRAASNSCNPELVKAKGKRFGYFEEPSENERINAGLMKEFTGGDKVYARGLHKDPIEFKPQWKLALLCNDIPEVPPHDSGTWRRMEIVEFKSRFCDNPRESHEFAIDKSLSEKLKNWKELFMALLIDKYYVMYKKKGIKVPTEVIKFTLEFQKQCDTYTDYIIEKLDETKEMDDILDMSEAYDEFKIWYEDTFSNHKYPSKVEFKKYLTKRYGKKIVTTKGIKGFKFKDTVNEKLKTSMINMNEIGY